MHTPLSLRAIDVGAVLQLSPFFSESSTLLEPTKSKFLKAIHHSVLLNQCYYKFHIMTYSLQACFHSRVHATLSLRPIDVGALFQSSPLFSQSSTQVEPTKSKFLTAILDPVLSIQCLASPSFMTYALQVCFH